MNVIAYNYEMFSKDQVDQRCLPSNILSFDGWVVLLSHDLCLCHHPRLIIKVIKRSLLRLQSKRLTFYLIDSQEGNFAKASTGEQHNPSDPDPLWIISYKDVNDETSCSNRCSCGILFLIKGGRGILYGDTRGSLFVFEDNFCILF